MRTSAEIKSPPRLLALDVVRGIAILLVLAAHLFGWDHTGNRGVDILYRLSSIGWIGVDLFFALSGFLITGILLQARGRPRYFINFYARRAFRILPLYFGLLILGLIYSSLHHRQENVQVFLHFQGWLWTFLVNVPIAHTNTVIPITAGPFAYNVFWSLAVEEQFYLIWPIVISVCPPRWLLSFCCSALLMSVAFRTLFIVRTGHMISVYAGTPFRLDGLLLGSACATLLHRKGFAQFFAGRVWSLIGIATIIISAGYLFTRWNIGAPMVGKIGYLALAVAGSSVLVACVLAPLDHPIRRIAEAQLLRFFGKYSYGIYALHETTINLIYPAIIKFAQGRFHSAVASGLIAKMASGAASVAVAYGSWHLFEKHCLRLKRYFPEPAVRPVGPVGDVVDCENLEVDRVAEYQSQ